MPRAARLLAFLASGPPCRRLAQPRSFPVGVWAPWRPGCCLPTAVEEPVSGGSEEGLGGLRVRGCVEAEEGRPCSVAASGALPTPDLARTILDSPCAFVPCAGFLAEPPLGAGKPSRIVSFGTHSRSHLCSARPSPPIATLFAGRDAPQALSEASVCPPPHGAWPRGRRHLWEDLDACAGVRKAGVLEAAGP